MPYTLPEGAALIFRMGYTRRKYEMCRAEGKARNFDVYPTWNDVRGYAKANLRPTGMIFSNDEAMAPLQSIADWQLGGLLSLKSSAPIKDRMTVLHNDGWSFEFLIKWGSDGFSDNSEYCDVSDANQKTIFATVGVSVRLMAEKKSANVILSEELWKNSMVNSWLSVFPIRYAFVPKENTGILILHRYDNFMTIGPIIYFSNGRSHQDIALLRHW